MSNFPLYDNLTKNLKKRDLTVKQKAEFMTQVKQIDTNGMELVYALIKVYQLQHSEPDKVKGLPYSGINKDDRLEFDLEKFPPSLKQILYKFVGMHLQTMEEESQLEEQRV